MTAAQRRLITMFVRFHNHVDDMYTRQHEAEHCDREFDGGEWSGPAHAALREELADRIAQRLGFDSADTVVQACDLVGFEFLLDSSYAYRCADARAAFFGYEALQ